jgi:hypothetical protein
MDFAQEWLLGLETILQQGWLLVKPIPGTDLQDAVMGEYNLEVYVGKGGRFD